MNPEFMAAMQEQGIDPETMTPEQMQELQTMWEQQNQQQAPMDDPNVAQPMQDPMMQQQPQMGQDPMMMGQEPPFNPDAMSPELAIGPLDMLEDVITSYMTYAIELAGKQELGDNVKGAFLVQMAQSLSYLVPLIPNDQDMQMKQAELQMKFQEMQANLEFKKQEMDMNMQMKQQELQMKQQESQVKLQAEQEKSQMKLQQENQKHQLNLVQSQEAHESSMEQQKQAAQLKQSSNPTNDKGGK